jgi:hypothetical protein
MIKKLSFKKKVFLVVGVTALLVVLIFILTRRREKKEEVFEGGKPVLEEEGVGPGEVELPTSELPLGVSENLNDWKKFGEAGSDYNFLYPTNAEIKETEGLVSLSIFGPTQQKGSEHYDSVYLVFEEHALEGKTFKEIAENKVNNYSSSGGESKIVEGLSEVEVGGNRGYAFKTDSYRYIYLERVGGKYLLVTDGTKDPAGLGFERIVEKILGTVE